MAEVKPNDPLVSLTLGQHTIVLTATDSDGNAASVSVPVLVREIKPQMKPETSIGRQADDVHLSWAHVVTDTVGNSVAVTHYEVWRSVTPYLNPYDGIAVKLAEVAAPASPGDTVSYSDVGALDPTGVNYYYLVRAISLDGQISSPNRVGAFNFELTPGGN